jgi:flagellar basal-body rod protein FlgF
MSDVFQIAAVGLLEAKQRVEAVSLNAANASVPGYRRHVVVGRAFDPALVAVEPAAAPDSATRASAHLVDLQRGGLVTSGRNLDLAIDANDAFFALTDGLQTWLTRAGAFRVNDEGVLVGEGGLRVIGTQGDLRLPGSDVVVAPDGRITHDGLVVGTVQLFSPNDRSSLQAAQGALLVAADGIDAIEPGDALIRSGALEASNTDAGREMLSLMAISRQFESLSRVLQGYDELLGRTIQKLGGV